MNKTRLWLMVLAIMITTNVFGMTPTKDEMALADQWKTPQFSFVYDKASSKDFLATWSVSEEVKKLDDTRTQHTRTYTDPKTSLQVRCMAIEYHDFPAIEWVMYFSNTGTTNSPILEKILPLDLHLPAQAKDGFVLHHTAGEFNSAKSFAPLDKVFTPGHGRLPSPLRHAADDPRMARGLFSMWTGIRAVWLSPSDGRDSGRPPARTIAAGSNRGAGGSPSDALYAASRRDGADATHAAGFLEWQ